jgi:hypothetical protein
LWAIRGDEDQSGGENAKGAGIEVEASVYAELMVKGVLKRFVSVNL